MQRQNVEHWLQGIQRGENKEWLMGTEFHLGKMEKVLKSDGRDGCTIM